MAGGEFPRASLSDSRVASALHEQGQVGLAVAAKNREIDLHALNPARLCEHDGLWLEALRGEDPARAVERRVAADALEVAAELLDGVDGPHALDLDSDPAVVLVSAHQVDGPDVGRPL